MAKILMETTHIEFVMQFCLALFKAHGPQIRRASGLYLRSLRSLQKALSVHFNELKRMGDKTKYLLDYVTLPLRGSSNSRGAGARGSAARGSAARVSAALAPAAKRAKRN